MMKSKIGKKNKGGKLTWQLRRLGKFMERTDIGSARVLGFRLDGTGRVRQMGVRIFEADNFDKTGTHDYTIVRITRNTAEECDEEMEWQICDGYFENSSTGKIVEINMGVIK